MLIHAVKHIALESKILQEYVFTFKYDVNGEVTMSGLDDSQRKGAEPTMSSQVC